MRAPHEKVNLECGKSAEKVVNNLSSKPAFYSLDLSSRGGCKPTASIRAKDGSVVEEFGVDEPDKTQTFRIEIPSKGYLDIFCSFDSAGKGCAYQLFEDN